MVSLSTWLKYFEEVEDRRPRQVGREHDRVFVGRVDGGEPVALVAQRRNLELGVAHAQQVVLDVVAGELATGVPLHHLAQIELDLLTVGAQVPTFGQLGLRLEIGVVADQAIEDPPGGVELVGRGVVPVEGRDVAGHAEAQSA